MKISIVIPNYNGKDLLEKNLPSVIEAMNNPKNNICELVIVDNGSTDDSVSYLNQNFKDQFKLIKHTKNRGFSAAVNIGARATKGDLILLLNNDVKPKIDFLENVEKLFKDNSVFAVSLHEKGHGASSASFKDGIIDISFTKKESEKVELTFYVSGAAGLFRKTIWQELGGMDEKLLSPFYWEDIDLCFRASKRGYTNLWNPFGKVIHNHESTSSKLPKKYVDRIRERNQLLMLWKNLHSKAMFNKHLNGLFKRILKNPGYIRIVFMSLLKLGLVIKARRKEIKECVVSDEAVFQKYQ
jgi:GT2 family glycosyltransferase